MEQPPIYSNYPRGGNAWGGYPPGVYFDFIGKAWEEVKKNLGVWVVSTLVAGLLYYSVYFGMSFVSNLIIYGSVFGSATASTEVAAANLPKAVVASIFQFAVTSALQAILVAGMVRMALDHLQGQPVAFRLFWALPKAVPLLIVGFLVGLVTSIGFVLCIVPGIYLQGITAFASLYVAFKDEAPIAAITSSMNSLKPYAWSMFGLQFVLGLLIGVSGCCIVGPLFTVPIAAMTMAMHWNIFEPEGPMPGAYGGPMTPQPPMEGPGMSPPPSY